MSGEEVDRAVRRVEARRPDLTMAAQAVAGGLTAGEGIAMIHQAALQHYLWWYMPRDYPDDEWQGLVEAAAALLDELGLPRLADVARSPATRTVLAAWAHGRKEGAAAFRSAHAKSGVEPPDTALLAWGSVMGVDEARALDAVERALGDAVAAGTLVPGALRWQAKASAITDAVLSRPLDLPPGQTLAGLVTTERIGTWIDAARHPVHQEWRSGVANRLLHPIEPPPDTGDAVAPMRWLLELAVAPDGTELTQSNYLARATVLAAVERFGWWDWEKPPRSEADVHQLSTLRDAANRLRLLRRRGPAAARHDPRGRAPRLPGTLVGPGCHRDRGRRRLHPCRHGGGGSPPPSGTGRATRARSRCHPDPHCPGLVDGRRSDHREPCLFSRISPTSLVATVRRHRRGRGDVGVRHRSRAHPTHDRPDFRRRAHGARVPPLAGRRSAPTGG